MEQKQKVGDSQQNLKTKVQRALQNIRQLKNQVALQATHREYLQLYQVHVRSVIQQLKDSFPKKGGLDRLDPNIAIKKLEIQTLTKKQRKDKWINTDSKCKPSHHLKEIFQQKNNEKLIDSLKTKLQSLYKVIQSGLEKEEPYIHQKLLSRIKKQTKRQGKLRVLAELGNQIKKHKDWLRDNHKKLQIQSMHRQIENKTVNNLEKMKQLMGEKVAINDYIYSMVENEEQEKYHLKEFDRLGKFLKQNLEESKNRFSKHKANLSYDNIRNKKFEKKIALNFQEIQMVVSDARGILKGSNEQNSKKIMNRIVRIQEMTDRLNKIV